MIIAGLHKKDSMVEYKIMWGWKLRVSAANIVYMYWDTSYAYTIPQSQAEL